MHTWQRWREPLAVVLLAALALLLASRAAAGALALGHGTGRGLLGGVPAADELLLVAAAAAVVWCATPLPVRDLDGFGGDGEGGARPSPHAWGIAIAGLVIIGLTVVGWLLLAVWDAVLMTSLPTSNLGLALLAAEGLLRLTLPVVALVALALAVGRVAVLRSAPGPERLTDGDFPAGAGDRAVATEPEPLPAPPERLPAAWQPDQAAGAVWLTADDAARGQPGVAWSSPGGESDRSGGHVGWSAPPSPDPATATSREPASAPESSPRSAGSAADPAPLSRRSAGEDDDLS